VICLENLVAIRELTGSLGNLILPWLARLPWSTANWPRMGSAQRPGQPIRRLSPVLMTP